MNPRSYTSPWSLIWDIKTVSLFAIGASCGAERVYFLQVQSHRGDCKNIHRLTEKMEADVSLFFHPFFQELAKTGMNQSLCSLAIPRPHTDIHMLLITCNGSCRERKSELDSGWQEWDKAVTMSVGLKRRNLTIIQYAPKIANIIYSDSYMYPT